MLFENQFKPEKRYSEYHIIEYPEESGKRYIFDPYRFGIGLWCVLTQNNKPGKTLEKSRQEELNKYFFGRRQLPTLYERFMSASKEEREKLKEISIGWLQLKLRSLQKNIDTPNSITVNYPQFIEGRMYFYVYDAKLKDVLPKWDALPLTIVLEIYHDGFLGLNIHYLDVKKRLLFLNEIMNAMGSYTKGSDLYWLRMHYKDLKDSMSFEEHKVCVKRYLKTHIKSKILPIESHEWIYAASLPVQQFKYLNGQRK